MNPCKCHECKPVLDGMRADNAPLRSTGSQSVVELPRLDTAKLVSEAFERGRAAERDRCANVAGLYPVEAYSDTYEALRVRDDISEAIRKGLLPGAALCSLNKRES